MNTSANTSAQSNTSSFTNLAFDNKMVLVVRSQLILTSLLKPSATNGTEGMST